MRARNGTSGAIQWTSLVPVRLASSAQPEAVVLDKRGIAKSAAGAAATEQGRCVE